MPIANKYAAAAVVCAALLSLAPASASAAERPAKSAKHSKRPAKLTLTKEDRSSVIDIALHSKAVRRDGRDCSHLVQVIYERAGFPYKYADSEDLYAGVEGFQRVPRPQAADLIVWHGHVGIVTRPAQHSFFSFLSTGPKVDDFTSRYWKARGQPRFYRYVKNDPCPGCTLARGNGE